MVSTIDSAGRLVIPKPIREAARLRPGTPVRFRVDSGGVLVEPEPLTVTFERRGTLVVAVPKTPVPTLSSEDVTRTIDEIRESYTDTDTEP
jgi:AbrB family looped-hinge helix DNA binding protein